MRLTTSVVRKLGLTAAAIVALVLFYEASVTDSRTAATNAVARDTAGMPGPGDRLKFTATAYCKGTTTASGVAVKRGVAAADPALLPIGSVIHVDSLPKGYNGIYAIMDTGPRVQGRQIDIYMWSCHEALKFGRRLAQLTVLRLGWNPRDSTGGSAGRLLLRREQTQADPDPLTSRPLSVIESSMPH